MIQNSKIYEETYDEAVRNNEQTIAKIESFKKELEGVKQSLEENQKHLFQHIMAPLANGKALIKAKLIRTNDVIVFLGDKWCLRTSAARAIDICNRKIKRCNENLAEIEVQTKRFSSNIDASKELEIFPDEDLQEIIEPYDEEAEKLWREKHKARVLEFKKQEAAERIRQKDEEFFQKLNRLKEEEEKNSEFDSDESDDEDDSDSSMENGESFIQSGEGNIGVTRIPDTTKEFLKPAKASDYCELSTTRKSRHLSNDDGDISRIMDSSFQISELDEKQDSQPLLCDTKDAIIENCDENDRISKQHPKSSSSNDNDNATSTEKHDGSKKRVSFSNSDELKCYSPSESMDTVDTNIIRFKHSDKVASHSPGENDGFDSPSDIHRFLMRGFNPKSILKKEPQVFRDENLKYCPSFERSNIVSEEHVEGYTSPNVRETVIIGDIIERSPVELLEAKKSSRPPSKFRNSRFKSSVS